MQSLGQSSPTVVTRAVRLAGGIVTGIEETIAEETPITIAYNAVSHAVMMATPNDLEDFAVGFSLTEGLIDRADAVQSVDVVRYSRGIELQIETSADVAAGTRSRRLSGRTGCGICGKEDIEDVLRELPRVETGARFTAAAIARAMSELSARQPLNAATGAVHAAGWAEADGAVALVREDVGRHNALDKLIGALARAGRAAEARSGFVALTSRGSFELVQKAAILGVQLLATVSAPTGLAIRVANDVGITLAGFARDERVTLYTHAERVSV
jgi:FdhD protein